MKMKRFKVVTLAVAATVLLAATAAVAVPTRFVDVPADHTFSAAIDWMDENGITKGCNPPDNDRFCPEDYVTRDGGRQVEQHDNWLQLGNAWELPRHEDAQTVHFGGRVEFQHDRDGRLRAAWVDTRDVIGLPYDSFIVGHRTDTANTLRLWAARATRDFNLQFFNEGDYRRAVEEKIDTENISKVLYPNDQSDEGKALRLKQQYFFVACSIADIIRRFKKLHSDFRCCPTSSPSSSTTRTRRSPLPS